MSQEIERKFLVCGDFRRDVFESDRIAQGYICAAKGRTVRIRIREGRGYITIKGPSGSDGLARYEWEKEIPLVEAEELLLLSETPVIDKTRHLIRNTDGKHIWEVDEFHGANEGLVVAEIELGEENEGFDRPSWLGDEVTGIRKYYNSSLSSMPYSLWKEA